MGHVLEHRPGNIASTLGGVGGGSRHAFFGDAPDGTTEGQDTTQWWGSGDGTALGREPTAAVPPADHSAFHGQEWDAGYEVTDSETSDGNSAPVDLSDVQHLTENDQDAELFWQYHEAKRRWRSRVDKPSRLSRHVIKRAQRKGKGKGRRFGRRQARSFLADELSFKGKGKGNSSGQRTNPRGRDGQIMKCSICDSQYHLRARCPQSTATGSGTRGTIVPAGAQGTTHFLTQGPLANIVFMTTQDSQEPQADQPTP